MKSKYLLLFILITLVYSDDHLAEDEYFNLDNYIVKIKNKIKPDLSYHEVLYGKQYQRIISNSKRYVIERNNQTLKIVDLLLDETTELENTKEIKGIYFLNEASHKNLREEDFNPQFDKILTKYIKNMGLDSKLEYVSEYKDAELRPNFPEKWNELFIVVREKDLTVHMIPYDVHKWVLKNKQGTKEYYNYTEAMNKYNRLKRPKSLVHKSLNNLNQWIDLGKKSSE